MATNQLTPDSSYEEILKQASKQKSFIFKFSKAFPAYIVLAGAILLSIGGWYLVGQKVNSDRSAAFDKAVTSVLNRLEFKYRSDYQVLQSMRSLYDNYVQVVRDVFELYGTIPTRTYPSIMTIMYAPVVKNDGLEEFVHYVRSQGYYDYEIDTAGGARALYYPVEYVVPLEKNEHRSGFDLATNGILKTAVEKARDNNLVVSTEIFKVRLPDTSGFFLLSPIYNREAVIANSKDLISSFDGVLILEIDSKTFFESALGTGVASDTSIIFQCIDKSSEGKSSVVFESDNSFILAKGYKPDLKDVRQFKVADRVIEVHFASIPDFGGTFQKTLPFLTFLIGLLISFGFSAFILSIISSRARAVDLADRMTRSQRRILESTNDIIAVMDMNGDWRSMNRASIAIFGIAPDIMIGRNITEQLIDPEEKSKLLAIIHTNAEELTDRVVTQVSSGDNEIRWISWNLTVSKSDGFIYSIGRDISLEKIAEEEAALRSKQNQLAEQMAREVSEFKTYFMLKLSHQFRNLLTGMIGYLQLLSQKVYENEEEHDNFVELAVQSSEELFTFVSDIDDVASGGEKIEGKIELSQINFMRFINQVKEKIAASNEEEQNKLEFEILDGNEAGYVADVNYLANSFTDLILAITDGNPEAKIQLNAQENPYEAATEIQMVFPTNPRAQEMIAIYNKNLNSLINALKFDKKDILLKLSLAASTIRMLNGNIKIEALGDNDEIYVIITLPLNKPQD